MALFFKLVWTSLKQQTTYRAAIAAGLATNLFFGFLRAAVLIALFASTQTRQMGGMDQVDSINFVAISQAVITFLVIFGNNDLMRTVYSGEVGSDLLKPLSLFTYWMARDLGKALVNLVLRGMLFMLLFSIFYEVRLPQGVENWLAFFISLCLAWLVSFAWRFLVNLASFWTPEAIGIGRAAFAFSQLLSGFYMPLNLLPEWFGKLAAYTPFPSILNTPLQIYLGKLGGADLPGAFFAQFLWFLGLCGLCMLALRAGVRRLVVQGG
ncbi:MAG TPA: ABC-2 family transporter protein [Anaerolineaceae bacterium]|nr:ABC-2 family transporter protein [Anaerolineaceae bacterium]